MTEHVLPLAATGTSRQAARRRVLVLCAHFRCDRTRRRSRDRLQPLAGLHEHGDLADWPAPYAAKNGLPGRRRAGAG